MNGFMTYDREVLKLDEARVREAHRKLYLPPPQVTTVIPTAQELPIEWQYTTGQAGGRLPRADFDDSTGSVDRGALASRRTPGSVVRTRWKTPDIWLRREIEVQPVNTPIST